MAHLDDCETLDKNSNQVGHWPLNYHCPFIYVFGVYSSHSPKL